MLMLQGKCAVVVGGASGIGQAISLGFAEAGASVVATSRSPGAVDETARSIERSGQKTLRVCSDVTDAESLEQLRDTVTAEFGKIDILVNCAGITRRIPTLDCPESVWQEVLDVNFYGTLRACRIFGRDMVRRRAGRIINIASLASFVAFHEVAAYGASKAAVASLTKSLAVEWAHLGVCVNALAPGLFPTELNRQLLDSPRGHELKMRTPMGRFGDTREIVSAALYLASDASSFTTGQVLVVDGGFLSSGVNQ